MRYLINFDTIAWETPMRGVRHKVHRVNKRILRLVEYSQDMVPHWCNKGHVGHIVAGKFEIEFKTGIEVFNSGDVLFIPDGPEHSHRAIALTSIVVALFVEDA